MHKLDRTLLDGTGKRVFAHCRKCDSPLAELRGVDTASVIWVDDRRVGFQTTPKPDGASLYEFVCRCGAEPARRASTLDAEFAAASPKGRVYL